MNYLDPLLHRKYWEEEYDSERYSVYASLGSLDSSHPRSISANAIIEDVENLLYRLKAQEELSK